MRNVAVDVKVVAQSIVYKVIRNLPMVVTLINMPEVKGIVWGQKRALVIIRKGCSVSEKCLTLVNKKSFAHIVYEGNFDEY